MVPSAAMKSPRWMLLTAALSSMLAVGAARAAGLGESAPHRCSGCATGACQPRPFSYGYTPTHWRQWPGKWMPAPPTTPPNVQHQDVVIPDALDEGRYRERQRSDAPLTQEQRDEYGGLPTVDALTPGGTPAAPPTTPDTSNAVPQSPSGSGDLEPQFPALPAESQPADDLPFGVEPSNDPNPLRDLPNFDEPAGDAFPSDNLNPNRDPLPSDDLQPGGLRPDDLELPFGRLRSSSQEGVVAAPMAPASRAGQPGTTWNIGDNEDPEGHVAPRLVVGLPLAPLDGSLGSPFAASDLIAPEAMPGRKVPRRPAAADGSIHQVSHESVEPSEEVGPPERNPLRKRLRRDGNRLRRQSSSSSADAASRKLGSDAMIADLQPVLVDVTSPGILASERTSVNAAPADSRPSPASTNPLRAAK